MMQLKEPVIHYIGRELAETGLVKNEPWVPENVGAASALYDDKGLKVCAGIIAAVHPAGIDYLRQCPALAVAALHIIPRGRKTKLMSYTDGRQRLARHFAKHLAKGPKLRALLAECDLAAVHRRLSGHAMEERDWTTLRLLGRVNPSTVAQAMPEHPFDQKVWLDNLFYWVMQLQRRDMEPWTHFEWAVRNLQPTYAGRHRRMPDAMQSPETLADYLAVPTNLFNPAWDRARFSQVVEDWHKVMAELSGEERHAKQQGLSWDEPTDYGALPVEVEIDGITFTALRSGAQIWDEGRKMHHCVRSYTSQVMKGKCRLYSLRVGMIRHATLEIVREKDRWRNAQLKGPYNRHPGSDIEKAARAFVRQINEVDA